MRISLGCDHRGRKAIDELIPYLRGTGHEVVELGMEDDADRSCDYGATLGQLTCTLLFSGLRIYFVRSM